MANVREDAYRERAIRNIRLHDELVKAIMATDTHQCEVCLDNLLQRAAESLEHVLSLVYRDLCDG